MCQKDISFGSYIIKEYVKAQKQRSEKKEISPNTVPNYIKPIKVLLNQNDVEINWKKINILYPREVNSSDRAHSRDEINNMLKLSHDLTDKVILTMFSSAGFRLETWDYFTW